MLPIEPLPGAAVIGFIAERPPLRGSFSLILLQGMGWSDLNEDAKELLSRAKIKEKVMNGRFRLLLLLRGD